MRACQLSNVACHFAHDGGDELGALGGGRIMPARLLPQQHHLLDQPKVLVAPRLARPLQLLALLAAGGSWRGRNDPGESCGHCASLHQRRQRRLAAAAAGGGSSHRFCGTCGLVAAAGLPNGLLPGLPPAGLAPPAALCRLGGELPAAGPPGRLAPIAKTGASLALAVKHAVVKVSVDRDLGRPCTGLGDHRSKQQEKHNACKEEVHVICSCSHPVVVTFLHLMLLVRLRIWAPVLLRNSRIDACTCRYEPCCLKGTPASSAKVVSAWAETAP